MRKTVNTRNVGPVVFTDTEDEAAELVRDGVQAMGPRMVEAIANVNAILPGSQVIAINRLRGSRLSEIE